MTNSQWIGYSFTALALAAGLANSGTAADNGASGGSSGSVQQELQKLFNESGQAMPSMELQDLPYATTPQMDRVRETGLESPVARTKASSWKSRFGFGKSASASKKSAPTTEKRGVLGGLFGRIAKSSGKTGSKKKRSGGHPAGPPLSSANPPPIVYSPYAPRSAITADAQNTMKTNSPNQAAANSRAAAQDNIPALPFITPPSSFAVNQPTTSSAASSQPAVEPQTVAQSHPETPAVPAARPQPGATAPAADYRPSRTLSMPQKGMIQRPGYRAGQTGVGRGGLPLRRLTPRSLRNPTQAAQRPAASVVQQERSVAINRSDSDAGFAGPFEGGEDLLDDESLVWDSFEEPEAAMDSALDLTKSTAFESAQHTVSSAVDDAEAGEFPVDMTVTDDVSAWDEPATVGSPFTGARITADDDDSRTDETPVRDSIEFGDAEPLVDPNTITPPRDQNSWRDSLIESRRSARRGELADSFDSLESGRSGNPNGLRSSDREKLRTRRHLSGFMGFCPVILRDRHELVAASDEYCVAFGLKTYCFSSDAARKEFENNPTRYVPAAGGADVVALVNSGDEHPGSLRFARWYRERLYLFQSRETMAIFADHPGEYANQY